ncbi:exodeoxyribonuclease V subunit alpha [Vibrio sp. S4M6]|uniref:exodeoxyribonuclease V subunit alpha n=1 Tax=Vibrio sinus TaxID=2946865 RepID=UPI00202A0136|nr:exodeoxyribonuclease V subunit alpha [Vibrio sinus]MCL9782224.1 exodeoxyribonuclease V subunit alpha [Vibrio sinus]
MGSNLLDAMNALSKTGEIRHIDYQFGRFIHSLAGQYKNEMGFIACMLSMEVGKGNVCIELLDTQGVSAAFSSLVSRLFGHEPSTVDVVNGIEWQEVMSHCSVIGTNQQSTPLIFDGCRLYFQRYWYYECVLVSKLNILSKPSSIDNRERDHLAGVLDGLFERNYHYLYSSLCESKKNHSYSATVVQQHVCDHLDIVSPEHIDWPSVERLCSEANSVQQLKALEQLVPPSTCIDWQKVAASIALTRKLTVISGGPGTGKTTTVTKMLLALVAQAKQRGHAPTIELTAPTGKAAARLTESVAKAINSIVFDSELKEAIPTQSSTLHRLLGAMPNSSQFRHNRYQPLRLDILVIDEASMVDLSMMYRVIDALPAGAQLILLGDKDQLSSVEAGSVLGDICQFLDYGYSSQQAKSISALTRHMINSQSLSVPLVSDSLCMLQKSYRFDARSGIGQLARAINTGQYSHVENVYARDFSDIEHFSVSKTNMNQLIRKIADKYQAFLRCIQLTQCEQDSVNAAKLALDAFSRCRLLCALREGDFGVAGLNNKVEQRLAAGKWIHVAGELWYHGRPIMVTRNDHGLGLYNGDIGICIFDGERLRVFFELSDGSIKAFLPSRVPEHETAFAMTIHKSQGSEFDFVQMVLPKEHNPILTRELIYTGVTRARNQFELYSDKKVLRQAIKKKTERASGLAAKLEVLQ